MMEWLDGKLTALDYELFHFMRPDFLWALPIVLMIWLYLKKAGGTTQWEKYIPSAMVAALNVNGASQSAVWRWLLLLLWILLIVGAAGPTWEKQTAPVVQNQRSTVLALDLSPSMLAQDIKPDRLTRAKYKLIDILRAQQDGQIALIAYAGDAHTVSPLSDDPRTIEALLPALHPRIMPIAGSQAEAAAALAQQLLRDAGAGSGEVIFITDGLSKDAIENIESDFDRKHRLSILGIGSADSAPIPREGGGFVRKPNGEIVLASVNREELASLASALNGRYIDLQADDSDVELLTLSDVQFNEAWSEQEQQETFDAWADMGYLLALLALPMMLLLFQRGLVYLLPLVILLPLDVDAAETSGFQWKDLWRTKDQQAAELYAKGEFDRATDTFKNKAWSATSAYQSGNYDKAATSYSAGNDAVSLYNTGNALALGGKLEQAIEAYKQALELDPDLEDASHNKKVIEQLSQQQESESQDQQSEQNEQDQESSPDSGEQQAGDSQNQAGDKESTNGEEPSAGGEPSADQEPSAAQESSADKEPSASEESSADKDPSANESQNNQGSEQDKEENNATDQEAAAQSSSDRSEDDKQEHQATNSGDLSNAAPPLDDASEQWLRAIPDDPSGLLRRKFEHQSKLRARQGRSEQSEQSDTERY